MTTRTQTVTSSTGFLKGALFGAGCVIAGGLLFGGGQSEARAQVTTNPGLVEYHVVGQTIRGIDYAVLYKREGEELTRVDQFR
ncbi:MAG: hypothetical protein AAGD00_01840 [Planctomycetota bacterium]